MLNTIYKEVFGESVYSESFELQYHKSFIVNLKNANAHQIEELGQNVKQKVFENTGIKLNWEIERVGNRWKPSKTCMFYNWKVEVVLKERFP